jgi:hypothetical protein
MPDNLRKRLSGLQDARGTRGIMARGHARYGVSNAPKPGSLFNVQRAAKKRLQRINDRRRYR